MDISRRGFLGSALLVGGAAAVGSLAGCASTPDQATETTAEVTSGAPPTRDDIIVPHTASEKTASFGFCTFDTEEPPPLDPPATWDYEVDVVVAGTGGGLAAASRCASSGKSVIALEANNIHGGVSKSACLYYFATGTKCQLEAGIPDITEMLREQTLALYPPGERYEKHVDNCLKGMKDLVAWTEELGFAWEPGWIDGEQKVVFTVAPVGSQDGGNSFRMLTEIENFYDKVFLDNGGEYFFETRISGLVMENGEIIGVQATPNSGEPFFIKAEKGVILATGGMANNINMMKRYCPDAFYRSMVSNASNFDNGEGIRLGLGAGAGLDGYNNRGVFDGGIEGVDWNHMLYDADIQIARQPWLQIDILGEQMKYDIAEYSVVGETIARMPEAKIFSFFDANWEEYCEGFVLPMCRNLTKPDMPNQERWMGALDNDYRNGVNRAIEEDRIKSGNTPEELAEKLGIAPEYVKAAFDKWNEMVASGDGSAYGYQPEWLHPLDTPPFYGQALGAMTFSTRAGLAISENQEVLAEDGKVIPGLYAAGMTSGRPAYCICGDVGYAATSSFLAANHILATR
ncbi:MAG: FAD-binding protein [Coriobacteriales bacterium]|jgi:hypothetical protein|nr:FAD-binding protein [Coriobacteriales bacterium]